MSEPSRPHFQHQGPASNCVIAGKQLGWLSCSAYGTAMGIDKATQGARSPSGCEVRSAVAPQDLEDGLNLRQVAQAAKDKFGVTIEVHSGKEVCSPAYAASQLHAGRGFTLQGGTGALLDTPHRSTAGGVNHLIYINEGRGWNAAGLPTDVLVYDPAADGRRSGIEQGPAWWPWLLLLKFAAALQPWGEHDPRRLGQGKFYCGIFPDTEPHVHLAKRYGAVAMPHLPTPLKTFTKVRGRRINVRSGPSTNFPIVATMPAGAIFRAFQSTSSGQSLAHSKVWVGDHNGNRWIHSSGVKA